jgi:hypothetical protein
MDWGFPRLREYLYNHDCAFQRAIIISLALRNTLPRPFTLFLPKYVRQNRR